MLLNVEVIGEFAGEAARLRKGLFEGRLAVSAGEVCLSTSGAR